MFMVTNPNPPKPPQTRPPQPDNGIPFAHAGLQPTGHFKQQQITHGMSLGVIDLFEIVEIDEQDRAIDSVTRTVGECVLQTVGH